MNFRRNAVFATALIAMLGACQNQNTTQNYTGYVEAQSVAIAAPQSGWLTSVTVDRGANISEGQILFALDDTQTRALASSAENRARAASASATDLTKGARDADIAPLEAQRLQAQAGLDLARANEARFIPLHEQGYASDSQMDALRQARKSAEAQLANIDRTIMDRRIAARTDQISAAKAQANAALADHSAAQWVAEDRSVHARLTGRVDERLREPGEFVAAGQAVLTVRPKGREFVRFYIPQADLSKFQIGKAVHVTCDGCKTQNAHIRFIAQEAEFTPPVIYSVRERQKVMFLIEATPENPDAWHAGQPVDVSL